MVALANATRANGEWRFFANGQVGRLEFKALSLSDPRVTGGVASLPYISQPAASMSCQSTLAGFF